jgi:hypothetical protein
MPYSGSVIAAIKRTRYANVAHPAAVKNGAALMIQAELRAFAVPELAIPARL